MTPRSYFELRVVLCDRDEGGSFAKDLGLGIEVTRDDCELIAECLETAEFSSSCEGRKARQQAADLARHIRSEFLACPAEVGVCQ